MTSDREARNQETEQLLRKALQQHAQRVKPSPDAFFSINQRIARKEEGFKLPRMLRLQPSMVASILLLIALSVVTTLLLTRGDNSTQSVNVGATPSSTIPEDPSPEPPPPATNPEPPESNPPGIVSVEPTVQTGTSEPATNPPEPPATVSPPAPTTPAPTTTLVEPPTTEPPPPPPDTAYAIRPLQIASKGQVIVYKDHDTQSEQLGVIPVSLDEGIYLATSVRATDYDGNHWSEVVLPTGETGWVELETVAIVPSTLSETQKGDLVSVGYQLLGVVATNEASKSDSESPIFLPSTNSLNVSSRGVYVASVVGGGTIYNRYSPSEFLAAFGTEESDNPIITSLYSQLVCLTGETNVTLGDDSDIDAPVAMQVLPYVAITGISEGNTCTVLIHFDYLRGQAEIIGFSVYS